MIKRLMKRWNLGSTGDVVIVLVVFALTGTTVLLIKYPILKFFSGSEDINWKVSTIYYILILPFYNLILLLYGFLFGKFSFFWEFEKKMFRRMVGKKA